MEKRKNAFIHPDFGSNIEDGDRYSPPEKRFRVSGDKTPKQPHRVHQSPEEPRDSPQMSLLRQKQKDAFIVPDFGSDSEDGDSISSEPSEVSESEDEELSLSYHKQPVGKGLPTLEELHASFSYKKRPFPPDEEVIRRWCCALKNPKLIEDPKVTEIREENIRPFPFLPYTSLPLFKQNDGFHKKLKSWAKELVQHFNCSNDENLCFNDIEEVAAAPGCRCMLEIKVSKGDSDVLRILRGRVRDGEIENVDDAGVVEDVLDSDYESEGVEDDGGLEELLALKF